MTTLTAELFISIMSVFIFIIWDAGKAQTFKEIAHDVLREYLDEQEQVLVRPPLPPKPVLPNSALKSWRELALKQWGRSKSDLRLQAMEGNKILGNLCRNKVTDYNVAISNGLLADVVVPELRHRSCNGGTQPSDVLLGDFAEAALTMLEPALREQAVKEYLSVAGLLM